MSTATSLWIYMLIILGLGLAVFGWVFWSTRPKKKDGGTQQAP